MSVPEYRIPLWNYGLARLPWLSSLLGAAPRWLMWPQRFSAVVFLGWGCKASARRAEWYAKWSNGKVLHLEDGFIRSFGTGQYFPPLSLVLDDAGIYYDSTRPSALEDLLNSSTDVLVNINNDVERAQARLVDQSFSKYNHAPLLKETALRVSDVQRVLVVDQTLGDMSVELGAANADTFLAMLSAARAENPQATIYLKTHPEVSSGRKRGYLTHVENDSQTVVLRDAINPQSLLAKMDKVYVVSSTLGFEALLAGKPVTCFGLPWYAGWGATDDRQVCERRSRQRSVLELFAAAYFHYARYLNPFTHQRGNIFDVMDWLQLQRNQVNSQTGRYICIGLRRWKAANLKPMLSLFPERLLCVSDVSAARRLQLTAQDTLLVWGAMVASDVLSLASQTGARLLNMEDGFVRSVGLGSDLIRPLSLVLDKKGLYFDATRASDLECLLNEKAFSQEDLARAQQVRAFIVDHGITKYNLEPRQNVHWPSAGKRVVLVPGQVEDDASIRLGCTHIKTNLELLIAAREARPDAFIVYKPHPDVMSGNRAGCLALAAARQYADHVESGVSVVSCIEACDDVFTLTSLSGFDALLRGKSVVTFGQPFYAGWGLTEDCGLTTEVKARRTRRLSLDELVAGALLCYPVYWDWDLRGYTTCEAVLQRLVDMRDALQAKGSLESLRVGWWRRQGRKMRVLLRAWSN